MSVRKVNMLKEPPNSTLTYLPTFKLHLNFFHHLGGLLWQWVVFELGPGRAECHPFEDLLKGGTVGKATVSQALQVQAS